MNKAKRNIFFMILFFFLFLVMIGLLIVSSAIDKQTDGTTTLYTATVSSVDVTDTGNAVSADIYIREYDTSLYLTTSVCENIKMDDLRDLNEGEMIFFRIENIKVEQMNEVEFLDIVSLKTDKKEIFTLEQYNQYMRDTACPTRIAGFLFAFVFLGMSLRCYWKSRGSR